MKICTQCHTSNPDEALVCSKCGEDITKKYIHRHRVKHKGRHSRPAKRDALSIKMKIFGYTLVIIFIAALILYIHFSK